MSEPTAHGVNKAMDSIQQRLVDYASGIRYDALPPEVIHAAKARTIDTLGALIAGFFGAPCRIARAVAAQMPDPAGATVIGTRMRTTLEMAAFANSTTARQVELNDAYQWPGTSRGHPSDALTPLLSVCEHTGRDGRDFIVSIVLAYEIFMRFSDVLRNHPGFDHTNCLTVAVGTAAGKLFGLTPAELGHCISMAVVPNIVIREARAGRKSMLKSAAAGHASRAGVFAAILAGAGMEGPHLPFEGKAGWCELLLKKRFSLETMGGNGTPYKILDTGIKNRPANAKALSSMLAAEKAAPVNLDGVEKVTVEIHKNAMESVGSGEHTVNPQSREDADHSIPYLVAVTLLDGKVTLRSFDDTHLSHQGIRALMRKTEVTENDEFTRAYQRVPQQHRSRVTVLTKSGERLVGESGGDNDDLAAPRSDAQIEEKFRELTEDYLGAKRVNAILARLWDVDQMSQVAEIPPMFILS